MPRPTATTSAKSYFDKAMEYFDAENWSMAIEQFNKAIQIDPDDPSYLGWRGYVYIELHQYQNAITDYTQAIQLDPDEGLYYNNRGYVYWRITQKGKWKEDQRKACSLDSQYC